MDVQFHDVTIRRFFRRQSIRRQNCGGANTAVVDVVIVSERIVLHTAHGTFHGDMGMPGDKKDILMGIENFL